MDWKQEEATACNKQKWRRSVAQCVHKVKVKCQLQANSPICRHPLRELMMSSYMHASS